MSVLVKKALKDNLTYNDFKRSLESADNAVDAFVDLENEANERIEVIREKKRENEKAVKFFQGFIEETRGYFTRYLNDTGNKKLLGIKYKSISYQDEKKVTKTVTKRQIKLGRSYVDVDQLSKDDLIKALEDRGVKTRDKVEKVDSIKNASIIVLR